MHIVQEALVCGVAPLAWLRPDVIRPSRTRLRQVRFPLPPSPA